MAVDQGGGGGTGGLPFPGGDWAYIGSGNTSEAIPDLALESGADYRMTVDLPIAVPSWALGAFQGVFGVKAVTGVGNTVTIYFRA